ncbi:MAG: nuclease-related domain-containing protein [Verrucomicrobiota bacterium]
MIIKEADDKSSDLAMLESLAAGFGVAPNTRTKIEQEILKVRSGVKGEREAAYEINFHFGPAKNYAVIHDLRIEVEGRVAQIDHLLIGRFLDIWVCETKNFSDGLAINEEGEWARFYKGKPYGMGSPFEQNKKHIMVLNSLFKTGTVQLPTRLGFAIKPNMHNVVMVSKDARVTRPKTKVEGVESVIKSDQFRTMVERANESDDNPLTVAKLIGSETLENFARAIVAQHQPIAFNWAGKFGVKERSEEIAAEPKPKKKLICTKCSVAVEFNVARFCWLNKARFGEGIYCRDCQQGF